MEQDIPNKFVLDTLADESGLAIAVVDEASREISISNNNSICRSLNPNGEFTGQCSAFCGTAFDQVNETGGPVSFTCHAGLECRVIPALILEKPIAAIVGRTFVNAEDYRHATTRAISGDWSQYPPSELFENILLTASTSVLDNTVKTVGDLLAAASLPSPAVVDAEPSNREPDVLNEDKPAEDISGPVERFYSEISPQGSQTGTRSVSKKGERRTAEAKAWRSFFGSLLNADYPNATGSILEFLALQYGFSALIWLDKRDDRLENTAAHGEMKGRRLRLGIAANDRRLLEASQNEVPLELGERPKDSSAASPRTMNLFPIGIGGEISAAVAILDTIGDADIKRQIARICHSIGPQLEILRLRSKIAIEETRSAAVQKFTDSLERIDTDDLWLTLTQNAAEMLRAERASLLLYDEKAKKLEVKALIGSKNTPATNEEIGERVSRIVFANNEPVAVSDVAKTGLPSAPIDREYKSISFLSCPIAISGRAIGVMNFTDKASG
ncbi:MAG: PocR ligand-binding domain-containing protein, partial [Pyrinomonadaceae bacterium]